MRDNRERLKQLVEEWKKQGKTKTDLARRLFPTQKDALRYLNLVLEGKRNIRKGKSKYYNVVKKLYENYVPKYQAEFYFEDVVGKRDYYSSYITIYGLNKKEVKQIEDIFKEYKEDITSRYGEFKEKFETGRWIFNSNLNWGIAEYDGDERYIVDIDTRGVSFRDKFKDFENLKEFLRL